MGDCREKDSNADTTPRAFLLPLLASLRSHPTPLAHFTRTFLPLTDKLTNLSTGPESNPTTAKVWSVLADQCWSTLPAYCSDPPDLNSAFGRELSERLTKELYANPTLRPPILRALRNIVESQSQSQSQLQSQTQEGQKGATGNNERKTKNLRYLRGQAKNWLAVLFNVFASVERGERAQVGEVIGVWAGVAGENELAAAYRSVLGHLNASLAPIQLENHDHDHNHPHPRPDQRKVQGKEDTATTALQMLDILLVLAPYLPPTQKTEVVGVVVRAGVLDAGADVGEGLGAVQKVGMRLVGRTVELSGEGVLASVGGVSGLLKRLAGGASTGGGGKVRAPFSCFCYEHWHLYFYF
jgi:ribosomal RNA-processing protein 12